MHWYEATSVVGRSDSELKAVNHMWFLQAYYINCYVNTKQIPYIVSIKASTQTSTKSISIFHYEGNLYTFCLVLKFTKYSPCMIYLTIWKSGIFSK